MTGRPQTLTKGQQDEVQSIVRKMVITWVLIGLAILTGVTGVGLWQIKARVEKKMESLVAKQFEEPRIQEVVKNVASDRATALMTEQISPEVARFKTEVAAQLQELNSLVQKTRDLETESRKHEQSIQSVLAGLQLSLKQSQSANQRLEQTKQDIVEMQKCIATMRYYEMIGRNTIPNPYGKEMLDALNKLIAIAIPDPAERSKFVTELQTPEKDKNE